MVIDAMMVASMVRPYLEEIRKVTDQPIRYVVNTIIMGTIPLATSSTLRQR